MRRCSGDSPRHYRPALNPEGPAARRMPVVADATVEQRLNAAGVPRHQTTSASSGDNHRCSTTTSLFLNSLRLWPGRGRRTRGRAFRSAPRRPLEAHPRRPRARSLREPPAQRPARVSRLARGRPRASPRGRCSNAPGPRCVPRAPSPLVRSCICPRLGIERQYARGRAPLCTGFRTGATRAGRGGVSGRRSRRCCPPARWLCRTQRATSDCGPAGVGGRRGSHGRRDSRPTCPQDGRRP